MKQVLLAAVAATFVFASAAQATAPAAKADQAAPAVTMTEKECTDAMAACGTDEACKKALEEKGCKAPQ